MSESIPCGFRKQNTHVSLRERALSALHKMQCLQLFIVPKDKLDQLHCLSTDLGAFVSFRLHSKFGLQFVTQPIKWYVLSGHVAKRTRRRSKSPKYFRGAGGGTNPSPMNRVIWSAVRRVTRENTNMEFECMILFLWSPLKPEQQHHG